MYVAYYLILVLTTQSWPVLLGPYPSQDACMDVEKRLAECELEPQGCSVMVVPQEAAAVREEDVPVCVRSVVQLAEQVSPE